MNRPRRRYEVRHPELNERIEELVARAEALYGREAPGDFLRQMMVTVLRFLGDGTATADVKLVNSALKELRHAFRVFAPYEQVRKVAVFGSARTEPGSPDYRQAQAFAERIVSEGWMVITGAGGGIMGAAQAGAGRDESFGVNIRLPFEQRANEVIEGDPKLINFRYFFTRKVTFVREAHAIVLFPGGFGTHDEGFEALTLIQTGRSEILPVVFVDAPGGHYWQDWRSYVDGHLRARDLISEDDLSLFRITDDVDTAVHEVLDFYRNYHSSRFVDGRLVLRVHVAPDPEQLERLNARFEELLVGGRIEVCEALAAEADEVPHLPRVALRFDRRRAGLLRRLIDDLNALASEPSSPREAVWHDIVPEAMPPEAERAELDDE